MINAAKALLASLVVTLLLIGCDSGGGGGGGNTIPDHIEAYPFGVLYALREARELTPSEQDAYDALLTREPLVLFAMDFHRKQWAGLKYDGSISAYAYWTTLNTLNVPSGNNFVDLEISAESAWIPYAAITAMDDTGQLTYWSGTPAAHPTAVRFCEPTVAVSLTRAIPGLNVFAAQVITDQGELRTAGGLGHRRESNGYEINNGNINVDPCDASTYDFDDEVHPRHINKYPLMTPVPGPGAGPLLVHGAYYIDQAWTLNVIPELVAEGYVLPTGLPTMQTIQTIEPRPSADQTDQYVMGLGQDGGVTVWRNHQILPVPDIATSNVVSIKMIPGSQRSDLTLVQDAVLAIVKTNGSAWVWAYDGLELEGPAERVAGTSSAVRVQSGSLLGRSERFVFLNGP